MTSTMAPVTSFHNKTDHLSSEGTCKAVNEQTPGAHFMTQSPLVVASPGILRSAEAGSKKRLSVTFEDSPPPLRLSSVLLQLAQGSSDAYKQLCAELSSASMSCSVLLHALNEVEQCCSELCHQQHRPLIRACLACNWHILPSHSVNRYFSLAVLLATTQPDCATDSVKALVHALQFTDEEAVINDDTSSSSSSSLCGVQHQLPSLPESPVKPALSCSNFSATVRNLFTAREQVVHHTAVDSISAILRIVPMAVEVTISTVIYRMPYMRRPARQQAAYISNMLLLASSLHDSAQSQRILHAVFQRLIQLDLLCPRHDLQSLQLRHHQEQQQQDDDDVTLENHSGDVHHDPGEHNVSSSLSELQETAHILDILMEVVLKHLHARCYPSSKLTCSTASDNDAATTTSTSIVSTDDSALCAARGDTSKQLDLTATKQVYSQMLQITDALLLPTSCTVHVQFVLLWLLSRRQSLLEHCVDWLWRRVVAAGGGAASIMTPPLAAPVRLTAALYLGSLLARATFASVSLVCATLEVMCGWLHGYLDQQARASCATNAADAPLFVAHSTFYGVCQAVFYVIAFRHADLTSSTNSQIGFLRSLNVQRLVTSHLNPLNFCMKSVVGNFARVARHYQLAYCHTIVARNSRVSIPVVFCDSFGRQRSQFEGCQTTWFPFDPYLLETSRAFIDDVYRQYTADDELMMTDDEDMDEDEDSHCSDLSDDDDDEDSLNQPADLLDAAKFSVSPGFMQH